MRRTAKIGLIAAIGTMACLASPADARWNGPGYYGPVTRGVPYRYNYGWNRGYHYHNNYYNWVAPLTLGLGALALGAAIAVPPYYYAPPPPAYAYPPPYPYGPYYAPSPYYWRY